MRDTRLPVHVTWTTGRHHSDVLRIEWNSFQDPWTRDDLLRRMRETDCFGIVAEAIGPGAHERVVGYAIYELSQVSIRILRLAVDDEYYRRGVGAELVAKLAGKLIGRRQQLLAEVRETNTPAQLFFRSQGFRAVRTWRKYFDDTGEDAYLFRLGSPQEPLAHRIREFENRDAHLAD